MNSKNRQKFAAIMRNAWSLARYGVNKFGGNSVDYFRMALIITWYDEKHPSIRQRGGGMRFLLPGMNIKRASKQSHLVLPGMSL